MDEFPTVQMPPTEDVIKENLNRKIRYCAVIFTRIEFKEEEEARIGSQPFPVRLRKTHNNLMFVDW